MSTVRKVAPLTHDDYLAGERHSNVKHEYVAGYVYAMVGVSEPHNLISINLALALRNHLRGTDCRAFIADMKVQVETANTFYYPDVMVTCARDDNHPYYKTQPVLVIEVLSPSTEARDHLEKRVAYQSLPSLKEYVLVTQDKAEIIVHRRQDKDWETETYSEHDDLNLQSVALVLPVSAVYEEVWRTSAP